MSATVRLRHSPPTRPVALAALAAAGLVLLLGPAAAPGPRCPADMTPVPGLAGCIDRVEASVDKGRARARRGALPATNVTAAEAQAACQAGGKRLCRDDEWLAACRGEKRQWHFPYGEQYEPERCFGWERSQRQKAKGPTKTGTHPRCTTPEGILALSGNAWEWVDRGAGQPAWLRGGGYGNAFMDMACTARERPLPDYRSCAAGFRCCVDLAR
ncbi:MAG: SUMF1/EgtB/PvdO family nonheme iron enzyme [Deltaproteobacteria bacterium]|nr:SUMF1/EgtB/PvdO family nonheme iron enzyme [Deltaproteobacteria bacterium]